MKYIWSATDVRPGRCVCKSESSAKEDINWHAKWTYKIGWICQNDAAGKSLVTICLVDGMTSKTKSAQEIADWLNKEEMMPMPHKRLIEVMNSIRETLE